MSLSALTAKTLLTPEERIEQPLVLLDGAHIVEVTSRVERSVPVNSRHIDFPDATLAPGFLDIHIHGGAGHDVMERGDDAFPIMQRFLAQHGVTGYLPTTVTAPMNQILETLERIAKQIDHTGRAENSQQLQAQPLGIHIEGPFLSHERRGVHPPEFLQKPTVPLLNRLWEASGGHIKLMTIAPELEGAMEVIGEAVRLGICVSLGHSDAHIGSARSAHSAGARHATHTFNAMRPLNHRDPGILGFVLSEREMTADIIVDGIHVDPEVVDIFFRTKGSDRAVLITDALSAAGMPDGQYRLGSFEFEVRDGRCTAHGTLAGSVLTMDRAVRNVMQFAHIDLQNALRGATSNPAAVIGLANQRGALTPGSIADIVVLDDQQQVVQTIVRGQGI